MNPNNGHPRISLTDFLVAFFMGIEEIWFRFFKPKGAPKGPPHFKAEKVAVTLSRLANDKPLQALLLKLNETRGA